MLTPAQESGSSEKSQHPGTQRKGAKPTKTQRRARRRWGASDLSLIAVFAAIIAAFAFVPAIPVGALGVPITLQTLAVALTGMLLGPARGFAAVGLYVLVGLVGLPVFSGFSGGFGVLAGPSAGYLIAFPFAAALIGALAKLAIRHTRRLRGLWLFASGLAGSLVFIHPLGIAGMMINGKLDLTAAVAADIIFLPGDLIKNVLAALIALSVLRAFPRLLTGPRTAVGAPDIR